ncbi:hypothetical protein C900_01276 [Fulvivirga imtechensis AK7]|uniref:Uncharacterized protein n=1 Tax=Fulvivirga imtechensis AK7 TaxID=1237149 RepID=L8JID3_9BACT|nr:hypothetical protein [Fulvivirga imtechensis]ELR68013.1 hypothetical protein C900_01276 [Fulvivirga imtechensis AK7]
MQKYIFTLAVAFMPTFCLAQSNGDEYKSSKDLQITHAEVQYLEDLELLVFQVKVAGEAGKTVPKAVGKMDGAPVLGYVFPTTLNATDVGFSATEGIVALAVTSHPDFDDTPLWDENNDRNYANDGVVFHTHWVVLHEDKRVAGGLAVKHYKKTDQVVLPPTNPGMPMYMDSPGYGVVLKGQTLKVLVPAQRINYQKHFNYDAVTAFMKVNASDESRPMLGVYEVYSVLSGNLSLPYTVK